MPANLFDLLISFISLFNTFHSIACFAGAAYCSYAVFLISKMRSIFPPPSPLATSKKNAFPKGRRLPRKRGGEFASQSTMRASEALAPTMVHCGRPRRGFPYEYNAGERGRSPPTNLGSRLPRIEISLLLGRQSINLNAHRI
jgi:hypothetical protein